MIKWLVWTETSETVFMPRIFLSTISSLFLYLIEVYFPYEMIKLCFIIITKNILKLGMSCKLSRQKNFKNMNYCFSVLTMNIDPCRRRFHGNKFCMVYKQIEVPFYFIELTWIVILTV